MTVRKLYKLLGKLVENGFGNREALVAKESFSHPLESAGVTNLEIQGAKPKVIYITDGDGGMIVNKDGSERLRSCVIIFGFDYLADGNPYEPRVRVCPNPTEASPQDHHPAGGAERGGDV